MSYTSQNAMAGEQNRNSRHNGQNMAPAPYGPQQGGGHDGAPMHYPQHDGGLGGLVGSFGNMSVAGSNLHQGGPMMPPAGYMGPADVPVGYPTFGGHPVHPSMVLPHEAYFPGGVTGNAFMQPANIPAAFGGYMVPYTPGRAASYGGDRGFQRELPGLDNRRASYSTTATESTPGTPFFGAMGGDGHKNPRILSGDRSSYTTPSPQQLAVSGMIGQQVTPKAKRIAEADLRALMEIEPAIPAAVPAVFTTPEQRKSLDQCLENRIEGNKNCYIRGLHPTTDDELLLKFCNRFGEVEQSKAIIDTATGACKGFGFAKFKDVHDSEKCIQGFYLQGYEVGFARESFNARLKAEGDEGSTNLYISNLPKSVTEAQLVAIFTPYQILSSKILRDSMGNSRGVGFARFETRDVCKEVIKRFHGIPIGDEEFVMQVRYADTPAQKELKRITAERRQYRTNEYNIGAYGSMAVGQTPTIYGTGSWGRSTRYANPSARPDRFRSVLSAQNGNVNMALGRDQQDGATASSEDGFGSADEGVTVIDSPTNGKSQSSPIVKKETA